MAKFTGFDIGLSPLLPFEVIIPCAQAAERSGFERVWISESYHARGAFTTLATVAHHTRSIKLGSGIISPFTRHPGLIAMEAAALDQLSQGRFTLGLGTAWAQIKMHQVRQAKPISALRDAVLMVRMLLRREGKVYRGKVFSFGEPGVELAFEPRRRDLPIYIGSMGPRTLRMAGEVADGVLLNFFLTPPFLKDALKHLTEGAKRAGRELKDLDLRSYLIVSVARDGKAARQAAREIVALYVARDAAEPRRYQFAGISDEERVSVRDRIRAELQSGDRAKAVSLVPDSWVEALTVSGTPEEVSLKLEAFAEAGLNAPACYQVLGPDRLQAIELLAKEVMPHFL